MSTKMRKRLFCFREFVTKGVRLGMKTHFESNAYEGCLDTIILFRSYNSPIVQMLYGRILLLYLCYTLSL